MFVKMEKELRRKSINISYSIGLPVGFFAILMLKVFPVMIVERLGTVMMCVFHAKPIIALIITLLIALRLGAINVYQDIRANKSLLETSLNYSLVINTIFWSFYTLIIVIGNNYINLLLIIFPLVAFLLTMIIATFTVGLLICKSIKLEIERQLASN